MAQPTRITPSMIQEYVRQGWWDSSTTLDLAATWARDFPQEEAIKGFTTCLTWSQVKEATDLLAWTFLEAGLQRDEVVAVQLPNRVEAFLLRLALKKAGLLGAYIPVVWREVETRRVLQRLGAAAVVIPAHFKGLSYLEMIRWLLPHTAIRCVFLVGAHSPGEVSSDALSLEGLKVVPLPVQACGEGIPPPEPPPEVGYGPFEVTTIAVSSGSTGEPKLCEWPEAAQVLVGRALASRLNLSRRDVTGIFAPLGGGAGAMTWLAALAVGSRMVLAHSFQAEELLALIEREGITFVGTVPTILVRMLRCPSLSRYNLSSLRVVRTGTAHLPPSVAREAERRLGCLIAPAAGSMEAITFAQTSIDDPPEVRLGGFVGKPLPGGEVKVVDEDGREVPIGEVGELWIRGAYTGSGYFRDVEATKQAWGEMGPGGWLRTGDLARLDPRGYLMLVGRKREVIVRGGHKVYPGELEALLLQHPKVEEVAVAGIPDPVLGEAICAFVVPRGREGPTLEELARFLEGQGIALYKIPQRLVLLPEFPRLENDKVDKGKLVREWGLGTREGG